MSSTVIDAITDALATEREVTVTRRADSKQATGKLVQLPETNDSGAVRYAVRTGKPGRPLVVTADELASVDFS